MMFLLKSDRTEIKRFAHSAYFQGMAWVLSQIKPQRLQNKVGVVNFNEENSKRHRQLIRAAMNLMTTLKNVDVLSVVINKHSDLLNLPPCKVFVVFVDFNQRNVILEDLQKVLGDLKLTTARAINKFSGETHFLNRLTSMATSSVQRSNPFWSHAPKNIQRNIDHLADEKKFERFEI